MSRLDLAASLTTTPPVLLLIFNRPDLTRAVLDRISVAMPSQLFVAADGPRRERNGEREACEETRRIAQRVNWPCEVNTLFRDENLGCRRAVSDAITWFFEHVEEGIVLEDDCIPDPSFFHYCSELLKRFRDDSRVMCISGSNFQQGRTRGDASYYFSIFNHCWGWASWRRAWNMYDAEMDGWKSYLESGQLNEMLGQVGASSWQRRFDSVVAENVDSWAYVWTFSCWLHHGLTALPNRNLTANVGFSERGTHTRRKTPALSVPLQSLDLPLCHPTHVRRNLAADQFTQRRLFQTPIDYLRALRNMLGNRFK